MSKINFNKSKLPPVVRSSVSYRANTYKNDEWVAMELSELQELKLVDLLEGKARIAIEIKVDGKCMYCITHSSDADIMRKRYPHSIIIDATKIANLFNGKISGELAFYRLPTIMQAAETFNAKVINYG